MRLPLRPLIVGLGLITALAAPAAAAPSNADDVLAVDASWAKAMVACDLERMKTIVSDDLTMVNTSGTLVNKESFLNTVKACPLAEAVPANVKVHIYGDTAVVLGMLSFKLKGQTAIGQQVYNRMYVLQGGAWRLVANSHTPITTAAAAAANVRR